MWPMASYCRNSSVNMTEPGRTRSMKLSNRVGPFTLGTERATTRPARCTMPSTGVLCDSGAGRPFGVKAPTATDIRLVHFDFRPGLDWIGIVLCHQLCSDQVCHAPRGFVSDA